MRHVYCSFVIAVFGASLWVSGVEAQQTSSQSRQPLPDLVADTLPLAGARNLTLGAPASGHSFLLPSFGISTSVETDPYSSTQANRPDLIESTYLIARLAATHNSSHSNLAIDYLAGGTFSTDSYQGNSGIHALSFSETLRFGRWTTMLGDQFSYTSQSPFDFGGQGGLNNLGVGLGSVVSGAGPEFRAGFLPNQSVLINGSERVSNSVIGEEDYALSHRSSLTFAGSYGLLDFAQTGFENSSNATFQGGYNHLLDRLNSIAVFYRFNEVMFSDLSQTISEHSMQLSYARRITGRLSLQAGAGPSVVLYHAPLSGRSTVPSWVASASLRYQHRRLGTGFLYDRSLTGGSGILAGATTDLFSGYVNHAFGRDWDGTILTGYSRNQALQQTTQNATNIAPQAWFMTARATRHFVRYGSLFISYGVSSQAGLSGLCMLPACQVNSLTHTASIGYNWALRPMGLE